MIILINVQLVASFIDTLIAIHRKEELKKATEAAQADTVLYKENFIHTKMINPDGIGECCMIVSKTLDAARLCRGQGRIGVLNFANPHIPGCGVWYGAGAQEESLCRCSNLYPCIAQKRMSKDFYQYHRDRKDHRYSNRLIYTKGITVFKTDDEIPRQLAIEEWFQVDVITCAAPCLKYNKEKGEEELKDLFQARIKNIFEAALENEVEILILGAFGCGMFANSPELVAEVFYKTIKKHQYLRCFKKIIFAVKRTNQKSCPNVTAFKQYFS